MTHKELDTRDYDAILRARTNADGTPRPGYRRNVEAIEAMRKSLRNAIAPTPISNHAGA